MHGWSWPTTWVPKSLLFWLLLIAAAYLAAWLLIYVFYLQTRSAVIVRIEARDFSGKARLTIDGGEGAAASWRLDPAQVRTLSVTGRNGRANIALPVAPARCSRVASDLGGTCFRGVVRTANALMTITWSAYENFLAHGSRAHPVVMTVPTARSTLGVPAQRLALSTGASPPSACFSPPASGTSVVESAVGLSRVKVGAESNSLSCGTSLHLQVGSGAPPDEESGLYFGQPRSAVFHASGRIAELIGAGDGTITVSKPHDERPLSSDQKVSVDGGGTLDIEAEFGPSPGSTVIRLHSTHVNSARLGGEEMVRTNFDRNKAIVVTAFFGGIGLLWGFVQLANFLHQRAGRSP